MGDETVKSSEEENGAPEAIHGVSVVYTCQLSTSLPVAENAGTNLTHNFPGSEPRNPILPVSA